MAGPLHILVLEDQPADFELVLRELRQGGLEFTALRVETESEFRRQLQEFKPDLILADCSLPVFDGRSALEMAKRDCPQIPFILVSGSLGEELAIKALQWGATDYVLKHHLARLTPAVQRALKEAEERGQLQQAQLGLQEAEGLYRSLVENLPLFILRKDLAGRFLFANQLLCQMLGKPLAEIVGKTDFDLFPHALAEKYRQDDQRVCASGQVLHTTESHQKPDGQSLYVEVIKTPLQDPQGQVIGLQGIFWDITERKQAEDEIRRLSQAVEQSPVSVLITDAAGKIEYVNPKFVQLTGYTLSEVLGQNPRLLKSGETPAGEYQRLWDTITAGQTWRGEFHDKKKNGELYWQAATISPIVDATGRITHFVAVNEDITGKKLLETQLLRSQRMESIGRLTGGIAHDLNNILAPILMSVDLLRSKQTAEEFNQTLKTIQASARRGAEIIKQLLIFGRGVEGSRLPVRLRAIVSDLRNIVRETFPKSITFNCVLTPDLWAVTGDPTQLYQALLNLLVNARDAMPNGGVLKVTAENIRLDDLALIPYPQIKPGPFVRLEVKDTGHGMAPEILDRIFEPFFTTKDSANGTGLGLSTTLGIVKNHGGFLDVQSHPGAGATFVIHLPADPHAAGAAGAPTPTESLPEGHGELVLFVDDELSIRQISGKLLQRHGYQVLLAEDGADGLAAFAQNRDRLRAVITDVVMPVMDGVLLVKSIKRLSPQTPILVCSGLRSALTPEKKAELAALGVRSYLAKPYTVTRLLTTLHHLLHSAPPAG